MTAGAVALLSGFTAACSSPMTTSATGPLPGSVSGQPMPPALVGTNPIANGQPTGYAAGTVNGPGAGASAVQIAALPPAGTAPANYGAPAPAPIAAAPVAAGPAAAAGGGAITAQPGDTLYSLSRQYGVSVAAIAATNGLTQSSTLTIGQRLVIPSPNSPAALGAAPLGTVPTPAGAPGATPVPSTTPAAARAQQTGGVAQAPGQHVVQNGETLYSIATGYGISPNALMQANGMAQAELLRVGQALVIPGATRAPATATSAPVTVATPPPAAPAPSPQPTPPPVATPAAPAQEIAIATPTQPAAAPAATTNGTTFRWPIQGRIISDFGPKPGGERNDGINFAAPEGADIRAAEAGTVIYAGNEIPGYGNLILIRHADNFVTAYAHTSAMLVAKDQTVTRGQVIGRVGQTGSVTSPQLHFELRRGSTPINPMDYLTN